MDLAWGVFVLGIVTFGELAWLAVVVWIVRRYRRAATAPARVIEGRLLDRAWVGYRSKRWELVLAIDEHLLLDRDGTLRPDPEEDVPMPVNASGGPAAELQDGDACRLLVLADGWCVISERC